MIGLGGASSYSGDGINVVRLYSSTAVPLWAHDVVREEQRGACPLVGAAVRLQKARSESAVLLLSAFVERERFAVMVRSESVTVATSVRRVVCFSSQTVARPR